MYPIIHVFGRTVGTYSLLAMIGFILSGFVACKLGKKYGIMSDDIILLCLSVGAGMLIGGHLLFGLTNLPDLVTVIKKIRTIEPRTVLLHIYADFGGMVFYGGLFGGIVAAGIHCNIAKTFSCEKIFDILAVVIPLFHFFGRVGCFFGGCCYGIECKVGFYVRENVLNPRVAGVTRLPVQLIEAGCNLALFWMLYRLFRNGKHRYKILRLYLMIYSTLRFCLEFFRGDEIRRIWVSLSTSQWISIIIWLGLAVVFLKGKLKAELAERLI